MRRGDGEARGGGRSAPQTITCLLEEGPEINLAVLARLPQARLLVLGLQVDLALVSLADDVPPQLQVHSPAATSSAALLSATSPPLLHAGQERPHEAAELVRAHGGCVEAAALKRVRILHLHGIPPLAAVGDPQGLPELPHRHCFDLVELGRRWLQGLPGCVVSVVPRAVAQVPYLPGLAHLVDGEAILPVEALLSCSKVLARVRVRLPLSKAATSPSSARRPEGYG